MSAIKTWTKGRFQCGMSYNTSWVLGLWFGATWCDICLFRWNVWAEWGKDEPEAERQAGRQQ